MIQAKFLYNNLRSLTEKTVNKIVAGEYQDETEMPYTYTQPEFHIDDNGKWSVKEIEHNAIRELSHEIFIDITDSKEAAQIVNYLIDHRLIKTPVFTDSKGKVVIQPSKSDFMWAGCQDGLIFEFVSKYLKKSLKLEMNDKIFNSVYAKYEERIVSKKMRRYLIVPLQNLLADVDFINFHSDVSIVKLDKQEKNLLASHMPLLYEYNKIRKNDLEIVTKIFTSGYAIKIKFDSYDEKELSVPPIVDNYQKDVVTSLRLTQNGGVSIDLEFIMQEMMTGDLELKMMQHTSPLLYVEKRPELHIKSNEVDSCIKVWNEIQDAYKFPDQGKLEIPLRKFNQLYERKSLEDKIIDASILLESTLLYGINDELSYRLSLRGAHLLKENRKISDTFNILKRLYDLRSNIIHNGERLNQPIKVRDSSYGANDFVAAIESICRDILKLYIEKVASGMSIKSFNETIDNEVLS